MSQNDAHEMSSDAPETAPAPDGQIPFVVIGPYRLLQQIGEGGMGEVWLCHAVGAGREGGS